MALIIWKKSQIQGLILKERMRERESADSEWKEKIQDLLDQQRSTYELKLQSKDAEIEMMSSIIRKSKERIRNAIHKEDHGKSLLLKARDILSKVDYCYTEHTENEAMLMTEMKNIKNELEIFSKKLLPGI